MAVKIYDTMTTASDGFPLAYAEKINIKKTDGSEENLQSLYNNGELGGSGGSGTSYIELSEEEYFALSDEERASEVEYRTYDTGRIFKRGVEFGKETDISSKQDNLSQVKFTMRRNSASEGRYCLIGSSDLSQNLLMCEPYRFQGIFGDGTTSVENKSIIDFMVSFREGVENPDDVLSGFANSSKGFDFVDLLITADETTNMAYAYVDFKVSGAVATGEITKPVLEAESYMDFAESFELVDTYQGTLVCKMSDYCKVITEIKDEVSDSTVWSSQKTSDKIDALISDTSSETSTYSSAKIDSKLAKYTKTYAGTHKRYIKIGSVSISSGVVTKTTLIMSLFAMSGTSAEYPVGLLNINISSGSGGDAFNINGTTTILLNNTNNLNTPRIVVDKTSTHYNLYIDCVYTYMWIEYMILNQDSNYENGNFEALDALEGAEYWSSVTSDDIKYVGDLAKLDDSSTGDTTSTWSSSKIASEITSTYLIKDIVAGGDNEKTVSFKIRKEYFSAYYAKRTFLLSANIYSLGFSKPVIGLVEIFRDSTDGYNGYVVNLQDTRYTGVTVTVNGDFLEVDVTFNSYDSSGCMVSCSSLSNVPIA